MSVLEGFHHATFTGLRLPAFVGRQRIGARGHGVSSRLANGGVWRSGSRSEHRFLSGSLIFVCSQRPEKRTQGASVGLEDSGQGCANEGVVRTVPGNLLGLEGIPLVEVEGNSHNPAAD